MKNTVAIISLKRIEENAKLLIKRAQAPLIAVVKDDAYGHGAEKVALTLSPYVFAFAVANAEEGAALRIAGVDKDILVLSPPVNQTDVLRHAYYNLTATLSSFSALRLIRSVVKEYGVPIHAHITINTGMNRYGFQPAHVKRALKEASTSMEITGVYSHFYAPENKVETEAQYNLFCSASDCVLDYAPHAIRHLSATGGILADSRYNFDAVRSGIALYGYLPWGFEKQLEVKPAMRLYAAALKSGKFTGGGVGYMTAAKRYQNLMTLRCGYGDGLFRAGGLGIGNLCMDACIREGKETYGKWRLILKDVSAYANMHNTTAYEVLTSAGEGAVKYYVR